jgi:hypothetical protein
MYTPVKLDLPYVEPAAYVVAEVEYAYAVAPPLDT